MENEAILKRILETYEEGMAGSKKAAAIAGKVSKGTATYQDAEELAIEGSRILSQGLEEYLPEALTDGKLYREAAEVVLKEPMIRNIETVGETTAEIQELLNESAGIHMNAIVPDVNMDQVDGIVTGVCNAESYEEIKQTLFAQVENLTLGYVDDSVRENAEFQYQAGLEPTIERTAMGKCCSWCQGLTGTYKYSDVRNKGNDVYRRHKNCRCMITYNPGNGSKRRQNVRTRQWTEDADPDMMDERRTTGLDGGEYQKKGAYNSKADPMAEAFGKGTDSNPEEIAAFKKECEECGVIIDNRDHESLSYQPSPTLGNPGRLCVSDDASYGAWCHEMKHMRDDRDSGWDGALRLWDKENHIRREEEAYEIEINMAEESGRDDIADRLRENLEAERRRINESP